MTPTIFLTFLAATVVVGSATLIAVSKTRDKARRAPNKPARRIHEA